MEIEYFVSYMVIATGARSLQNYLVNKSSAGRVDAVAQGADPQDVKSVSPPTN